MADRRRERWVIAGSRNFRVRPVARTRWWDAYEYAGGGLIAAGASLAHCLCDLERAVGRITCITIRPSQEPHP